MWLKIKYLIRGCTSKSKKYKNTIIFTDIWNLKFGKKLHILMINIK